MLTFTNGKEKFRKSKTADTLSIAMTGDCCPHNDAVESIKNGSSNEILKNIQPFLNSADISIIQWETPLTNAETPIIKSGPNLKCPPECVDFIKAGGFDIALLANNHIGDFGTPPVLETIEILNNNGIKTVGAGANLAEATKPLIFEKKGFKIAIINVAEHEFGTAGKNTPGCAPQEPVENIMTIKKVASEADITIVIIHGGNEKNPIPSPRMMRNCRAYAEAGASAVVNIHTHCPQGIELWNEVPIIYCPGNFFFPSSWEDFDESRFWWTGYVPKLQFDKIGAFSIEIEPFIFTPDPWVITTFTGDKKEQFCSYLSSISSILSSAEEISRYFDAWCAMMGPSCVKSIADCASLWPIDIEDPDAVKKLLPLRNRFSCGAHNELTKNFLRIVEEFRLPEAEKLIPEIKKLQKADFQ
ncbi:MAG: CapA family protein [Verrucomicrobiota bacterium]|nr:CapA family protein [Verrucomicrobiota bacterium]